MYVLSSISSISKHSVLVVCVVISLFLHLGGVFGYVTYRVIWPDDLEEEEHVKNSVDVIGNEEPIKLPNYLEGPDSESEETQEEESKKDLAVTPELKETEPEEQAEKTLEADHKEQEDKVAVIPEQGFARTSDEQKQGRNESATLQGERDTLAASAIAPDASAPARPGTDGKENEKSHHLFDSNYQDGEIEPKKVASESPAQSISQPVPPSAIPKETSAAREVGELDAEAANTQEMIASLTDTLVKDRSETIKHGEELFLPETPHLGQEEDAGPEPSDEDLSTEKSLESETTDQLADKLIEEQMKQLEKQSKLLDFAKLAQEKKAEEERKKKISQQDPFAQANANLPDDKKVFSEQTSKRRISSSLSRSVAVASQDVKSTPLGKYHSQVLKAVEKKWQRLCRENASHILPGTLNVNFSVSPAGKIHGISFVDSVAGAAANKGYTLESLQSAEVPPMSAEVKKILGNQPHQVTINFNFH